MNERDLLILLADIAEAKPTRWRICVEAGAQAAGLSGPELVELIGANVMAIDELMADRETDPRRLAVYEEIADTAETHVRSLERLGAQFV